MAGIMGKHKYELIKTGLSNIEQARFHFMKIYHFVL
jgi:hypothetical protein